MPDESYEEWLNKYNFNSYKPMTTPNTAPHPNLPKAPRSKGRNIAAIVVAVLALWLLLDAWVRQGSAIYHNVGATIFGIAGLGLAVYLASTNGGEQ